MTNLKCLKCESENFHPIETGTVIDPGTKTIYDPTVSMAFTPNKRVFVCINCGQVMDGIEQPVENHELLYVVSNSTSRASKELKTVDIELSTRVLRDLSGKSILSHGGVSIAREAVIDQILNSNPSELMGFEAIYLNR